MLYRLLSAIGALAHVPDALVAPLIARHKPGAAPIVAGARFAMPFVLGIFLVPLCIYAAIAGNEGAANPSPVTYTAAGLARTPDLHGRSWAILKGTIDENYVEHTRSGGGYDHSDYLVCDPDTLDCIVVISHKPESEMSQQVNVDSEVTLTGMLRSDSTEIDDALRILGSRIHLRVNQTLVLEEDQSPYNAVTAYAVAIVSGVVAVPLLIGWLIGYVVFRPSKQQPAAGQGMTGPLPVRVTGVLAGPGSGVRAREMPAELSLGDTDAAPAPGAPPTVDLIWVRGGAPWGVHFTAGLSDGVVGKSYPVRGASPSLRAKFHGQRVTLSFDDEGSRDAAYEQMRRSSWYAGTQAAAVYPAPAGYYAAPGAYPAPGGYPEPAGYYAAPIPPAPAPAPGQPAGDGPDTPVPGA